MNYAGLVAYKYKGEMPADGIVTIKEGTKGIAGDAFSNRNELVSVIIPDGVTAIGSSAFQYCQNLKTINIPNSVTTIGGSAFEGTGWYNEQPDGLVYAGLVAYKYKGSMPADYEIEWKEGTTGIAAYAFQRCGNLTSVTIPNTVQNVGSYAFDGCYNLSTVAIPRNVTHMGYFVFQYSIPDMYVEWETPIWLDSSVFTGYNSAVRGEMTLYVPIGTLSAYENAQYWKEFGTIEEYNSSLTDGIEDITADHAQSTTASNAIYTIDGKRVAKQVGDKLPRGLYIIGKKKVLVK